VKASLWATKRGIKIFPYNRPLTTEVELILHPLKDVSVLHTPNVFLDLFWNCGCFFSHQIAIQDRIGKGFMQGCAQSTIAETPIQSHVQFLPINDVDPNNKSCIYSTLVYISEHLAEQATKINIRIPCITFDQPLWLKVMLIIKTEEKLPIVCRLGGFHVLISFLRSVGKMMKGSSLEELFEEVYASNSVPHIMVGKPYARGAHT
jgi:hypothetical protein